MEYTRIDLTFQMSSASLWWFVQFTHVDVAVVRGTKLHTTLGHRTPSSTGVKSALLSSISPYPSYFGTGLPAYSDTITVTLRLQQASKLLALE